MESHQKANMESPDGYITPFYNWFTDKYPNILKKYAKINYLGQLKEMLTVQGLHTVRGKRLADIFNMNKDPSKLNDPLNIKSHFTNQCAHNRLKTRLKCIQTSIIKENDLELKFIVLAKLLQQSHYEKHVAIKMLEVRNQKDTIVNNKKIEHELLWKNIDEDFMQQLYQQKHGIALINAQNMLERKRMVELEKRLHDMKSKQIHEEEFNTCSEILYDMVDFSTKFPEYSRKLTCDFSGLVWKQWALEQQEILKILDNINNIIYITEDIRQLNAMSIDSVNRYNSSEKELADYLSLKGPWNLEFDDVDTNSTLFRCTVLFHIIHQLLLVKYPASPPQLPAVTTASVVIGIYDQQFYPHLDEFLKQKQIHMVHVHHAICYCLNSYLQEKRRQQEYYNLRRSHSSDISDDLNNKSGQITQRISEINDEKYLEDATENIENIPSMSVHTQTSGFFGLEFKFSRAAELGNYAYDILNSGQAINSHLLIDIIIQYLNTLENANGWVFNNYPELLDDAIHVESGLTGQLMEYNPYDENIENNTIDNNHPKRISQLSPKSKSGVTAVTTKSYLTSFVHILRKLRANAEENVSINIINESLSDTDSFYNALGCSNFFTYSVFEQKLIAQVGSLIATDKIFESEMYNIILDNAFKTIEEMQSDRKKSEIKRSINKKGKKAAVSKDKKSSKKSLSKDRKSVNVEQDQSPAIDELDPVQPGEPGWSYINMNQSEPIQQLLATLWQNTESSYINNLKELFVLKQFYEYTLLPYFLKTDTYLTNFIEKPSEIQNQLHEFQNEYNSVPNFCREDDEFKAELHCRIAELKITITNMCDQKMKESEAERVRIIQEHWFSNQTTAILNIYVRMMQGELNRCVHTFQLLQDYYTSMATQTINPTKFKSTTLDLFKYNESKLYTSIATLYVDSNASTLNFADKIMHHVLTNSNNAVNSWVSLATDSIKKLELNLLSGVKMPKKKGSKLLSTSQIAELTKNVNSFKEEYQCAVKEENFRVKFRLNLINQKTVNDINELICYGKLLFEKLNARLLQKHQDELNHINSICEIFANAVELGVNVEERVTMDDVKNELCYNENYVFRMQY